MKGLLNGNITTVHVLNCYNRSAVTSLCSSKSYLIDFLKCENLPSYPTDYQDLTSVRALKQVMRASGEKHRILQSLSLHSSHKAQVWKLGSRDPVQRLFTFPSLFLHHQVAKAFITSAATAPLLPASREEWTTIKKKEEAVIKDRGSGTISRPHPGSPVQEHDPLLRFYAASSCIQTKTASHHFSMCCLYLSTLKGMSTNMLWKIWLPEANSFLMNNKLIKNIPF